MLIEALVDAKRVVFLTQSTYKVNLIYSIREHNSSIP